MTDVVAIAKRHAAEAREKRKHLRERMPATAAIVDALRAAGLHPVYGEFREGSEYVRWGRRTHQGGTTVVASIPHKAPRRKGAK